MLATPETLGRTQDREWRVQVRRPPSQNRSTGRRHLCHGQLQYNNRATGRPNNAKNCHCYLGLKHFDPSFKYFLLTATCQVDIGHHLRVTRRIP